MTTIDLCVMIGYFAALIAIGWIFRTFITTTSDYFRGGGKMLWWMVGATAFMNQFSAWTFTGAAGKAFNDGFQVVIIFLANALGYFINYLFFASRVRQMRIITVMEGVRMRYGPVNEQIFTWVSMPMKFIQAGLWLSGLGIFVSAVFHVDIETTLIITGGIVILVSLVGGSWAVVASDYLQMIIVMSVSTVTTFIAISHMGGVSNVITEFPADNFITGGNINYIALFVAWAIFTFARQFFSTNNMVDSYRYLAAKDTKNARKAALLACLLMLIGPAIWFIPPWASASLFSDIGQMYPTLKNPAEASYLAFVQNIMPAGLVGLLMAAIFSATMSSMDTGLNQNTGIFVRSFYQPILRKGRAHDKELLLTSRIMTLFFGACIIMIAIFINNLKDLTLFDAMLYVSSLITLPVLIPMALGFYVKKIPDWAPGTTLIIGGAVSYCVPLAVPIVQDIFSLDISSREKSDLTVLVATIGHLTITMGYFLSTQLFYKPLPEARQESVNQFFHNISTEVVQEETDDPVDYDYKQRLILGRLVLISGIAISSLAVLPGSFQDRMVFVACASIMIAIGLALELSTRRKEPKSAIETP